MARCQEKAKHVKILKNQYDLLKKELNFFQNKNEAQKNYHISLVKEVPDKPLDKHQMDLQEFIINDFNITKLASMICDLSISKWEGIGFSLKSFNPRFETFCKPTNPSSSGSAHKGLNSYFVPAAENEKVLNQSEPKVIE